MKHDVSLEVLKERRRLLRVVTRVVRIMDRGGKHYQGALGVLLHYAHGLMEKSVKQKRKARK